MRKFIYLSIVFSIIFTGISSCKQDNKGSDDFSANDSNSNQEGVNNGTGLKSDEGNQPMGPLTKIKFKNEVYDFGKVMEGEVVKHEFVFVNDGDEPLILKNVSASCGCTTPLWPRDPIAPGATEKIHASFDTGGRGSVGGQPHNKTITVTGNFEGGSLQLSLKGLVDKKEDPESDKKESRKK